MATRGSNLAATMCLFQSAVDVRFSGYVFLLRGKVSVSSGHRELKCFENAAQNDSYFCSKFLSLNSQALIQHIKVHCKPPRQVSSFSHAFSGTLQALTRRLVFLKPFPRLRLVRWQINVNVNVCGSLHTSGFSYTNQLLIHLRKGYPFSNAFSGFSCELSRP